MVLHGIAIAVLYAAMWAGRAWLRVPDLPANPGANLAVSWTLIIARLATSVVNLDPNREAAALMEDGLSIQNQLQIGATFAAAAWAAYLVLGRSVRLSDLLRGPVYWVVLISVLFLASTAWSPLPALTFYRSFELLVFVVIVCHLFGQAPFERQARVLAFSVAGLIWTDGLILHPDRLLNIGDLFAALRHNQGSMIAAIWICLAVRRLRSPGGPWAWGELAIAVASLFVFGSFASALALLCGLAAMSLAASHGAYRSVTAFFFASLSLGTVFILLSGWLADPWQWVLVVADLFGKSEELLVTMSGRLPYWQAVWSAAADHPYGLGFGAAERFLGLDLDLENLPVITNSHSGYISAWLGAGWLGLALCLTVFVTAFLRVRAMTGSDQAVIFATLTIIAINNLTVAAVAGPLSPGLLMMIGLAAVPAAARPHPSQSS